MYFSIKFKVYNYYVLDYVIVSTIMLLIFASPKIIFKYPSNDWNYISKIDLPGYLFLKVDFLSVQKYQVYEQHYVSRIYVRCSQASETNTIL